VPVPDGLVRIALFTFLTALGCGLRNAGFIIAQCIRAQLQSVCSLTRTRRMQVAEFWRQVGAVTSNEDAVTHARPHACPLCQLLATEFFEIRKEHRSALETLIVQAAENHRVFLRFGCAARSLPDVCPQLVPPPAGAS